MPALIFLGDDYMRIAIDLGHGVGQDRGASSKYITEEEIIDNVGGLVINKLKELGHTVIEVRPSQASSVSNSLVQRVQKANNSKVDLYVSIHANAGGGTGTEVYTYHGKELQQARAVLNNLCSLGFNNRGIKGSNLFVVNHTNAPAMLIEVCFVDTQSDVELYKSIGNNRIADSIVKGLVGETSTVSNINRYVENKANTKAYNSHLRDFQSAYNKSYNKNILVDGLWGVQSNNAVNSIILKNGSRNDLVSWVQIRIGKCTVDGIFGPVTKQAVIEYQKAHKLVADGIVGPATLKCILKQYGVML